MRLADVKWCGPTGELRWLYSTNISDKRGAILDVSYNIDTKLYRTQPPLKISDLTALEFNCWLADKEPCDAPDPHPDY
jgi:hypothetical protein